ncbi:MAG: NAD(P)/FAD-dependent oxidoreductase [Clostridia bacterium]|nr:NAD(P)/FAD-dependent oxidoreductase [Clostridia bacterium]
MIYDIAVLGAGPAGTSAAVNAAILEKSVIWLGAGMEKTDTARAEKIRNYIGVPDVNGMELSRAFSEHAKMFGLVPSDETVTGVYKGEDGFTVLAGENSYETRSVILAVGMKGAKSAEGEEKFVGRGISYCATCDGFLYKGKTVGVFVDDKKFENEAAFLCSIAKFAYVFPMYRDCGLKGDNVEIVMKKPRAFEGGARLEKVVFDGGARKVDGMFLLRRALPFSALAPGLELIDGHVRAGRDMSTSVVGLFAAGDCTGRPYQIAKAVGEGNVAAHSAVEYVDSMRG